MTEQNLKIGFYIEVHAPMDQVIIGPFDTREAAETYAVNIRAKDHDAWVKTLHEMRADQEDYGTLPIMAPEDL